MYVCVHACMCVCMCMPMCVMQVLLFSFLRFEWLVHSHCYRHFPQAVPQCGCRLYLNSVQSANSLYVCSLTLWIFHYYCCWRQDMWGAFLCCDANCTGNMHFSNYTCLCIPMARGCDKNKTRHTCSRTLSPYRTCMQTLLTVNSPFSCLSLVLTRPGNCSTEAPTVSVK